MGRRQVRLHPAAESEAREARRWYASRDAGAATRFMQELDRAIARIADAPERWPAYLHCTQRILLRRFPYHIIYTSQADVVQVVALAHQRRKPGYWRTRQ